MAILGTALAFAILASLLPENEYQRWQLLDGTIHSNARWIYERCHFDPTPIDIAFLGPSRIDQGINAPRLSAELAARGLPSNVVNFALPESGRDINYVIAEQLFATKKPKLVVIGVTEKPSRFGHSAFKYIAEPEAIFAPGYLGDANYFSNLVYLPYRQLRLFIADLAPDLARLTKTFDRTKYLGSTVDTTGNVILPDGTIKNGLSPASPAELERGVRKLEAGMHPPLLPPALSNFEFGDERHYIEKIAELAKRNGAKVAFLFLPYQSGPSEIQEEKFYSRFGVVWNAGYLAPHAEWFADYGHLTQGATIRLADWLVGPVASELAPAGALNER
jgi:hypothetical protein